MMVSIEESIERMVSTVGWREDEGDGGGGMGVERMDSVRVKTKDRISSYVGEARNKAWSSGLIMRRIG